jgi:hypothetical protein
MAKWMDQFCWARLAQLFLRNQIGLAQVAHAVCPARVKPDLTLSLSSICQWFPIPRSPVVNSPIRGRLWRQYNPRGDLIKCKSLPVGEAGISYGTAVPNGESPVHPRHWL